MSTSTTKLATDAVTVQYDFWSATPDGKNLFSVRGGVPLSDAFDQLTVLLGSSIGALNHMASDPDAESIPGALWQQVHAMEFTFALVRAMHQGITPPGQKDA